MTKNDITTWALLVIFARERAKKSAKRNDPWAWAYWKQTAEWAAEIGRDLPPPKPHDLLRKIEVFQEATKMHAMCKRYAMAARAYSRAKWCAIIIRNLGGSIPRGKGPSLAWLHSMEREIVLMEGTA